METNAKTQLNKLVNVYSSILPTNTFPWVMLTFVAIAQFFAWFGGRYLFPKVGLCKRIFLLWCIALLQFVILRGKNRYDYKRTRQQKQTSFFS